MTAAAGTARSFVAFGFSRAGVAIGESALTPAANSIIADNTTPTTRPISLSIYTLGAPIGSALAFALGGVISDKYGWRAAFFLVGAVGALLTLLVALTVKEPAKRSDGRVRDLPRGDLASLLGNAAVRNVIMGGALTGLSFGAVRTWGPAYAMRTFHLSAAEVGPSLGGLHGVTGIVGMLIGGVVTSWLAGRRAGNAFRVLAILFIVATAAQFASLLTPSYGTFLAFTAVASVCVTFYSAPTMSAVQSLVDPSARSFSAAVAVFCISGVGMASSTFLTGLLSDLLRPAFGADSLRWAFMVPTFGHLWAAAHYYRAAKAMDASTDRGPPAGPADSTLRT
jgi:predicted MFS family arabinose efflux permease